MLVLFGLAGMANANDIARAQELLKECCNKLFLKLKLYNLVCFGRPAGCTRSDAAVVACDRHLPVRDESGRMPP